MTSEEALKYLADLIEDGATVCRNPSDGGFAIFESGAEYRGDTLLEAIEVAAQARQLQALKETEFIKFIGGTSKVDVTDPGIGPYIAAATTLLVIGSMVWLIRHC